jgi:hypothetical protein
MIRHDFKSAQRPRELRRRVVLPARLRAGSQWSDTCILNISSRGLLIHSGYAGPKGSFVEVRRGQHVIVARVAWRDGARAGLQSDERVPVEEIMSLGQCQALQLTAGRGAIVERRRHPRPPDASRLRSRWFEFAAVSMLGACLAVGMWAMAERAFAEPMAMVVQAFGNQS